MRAREGQGEERAWLETGRVTEGNALELGFEAEPRDFPAGPVAKTLRFQCRGPQFNPWSGN